MKTILSAAVAVAVLLAGSSVPARAQYGQKQVPQPPDLSKEQPDGRTTEEPRRTPTNEEKPDETSTKGAGAFATEPETGSPPARPPAAPPERAR